MTELLVGISAIVGIAAGVCTVLGYLEGHAQRGASPQRAKAALARMIQGEDPRRPLSDQALGERLQAAGMPLARRTVAKYRREMGLPPAYRRRR